MKDKVDDSLFAGTAKYYSKYRIGYQDAVIEALIEEFALTEGEVVLDLGCGTGQIAIPLSKYGCIVHAVDPDTKMLAEGINQERKIGGLGVRWQIGSDLTLLKLNLPKLKLCTMGASFHWMDRVNTLNKLHSLIQSSGGVAIISGGVSTWGNEGVDWSIEAKEVVQQFLGRERRAGKGVYMHPEKRHEDVLVDSYFSNIKKINIDSIIELSAEHIVGLQLSTSYASPTLLGNNIDSFKDELYRRLTKLEPSGKFTTNINTELIVARRI